jgi:rhodanese-related sulfurtransferase
MTSKKDEMANKLCQNDRFIINVLDKEYYDDAHIDGSINIPFDEIIAYKDTDFAKRGWNKETTELILYCGNYACGSSGAVAQDLVEKGFKKVFAYEGGVAEWNHAGKKIVGPAVKSKPFLDDWQKPVDDITRDAGVEIETQENYQKISTEDLQRKIDECVVKP